MKRILFLAAVLVAAPVMADYQASNGGDTVRLTDKPCPAEIMAQWPPQWGTEALFAVASVQGRQYSACWTADRAGRVLLQYEDGDQGMAPIQDFRKVPEV